MTASPHRPTLYGRDGGNEYALLNDGNAPLSVYTPITSTDSLNPTLGNYVVFSGLTGNGFAASITGMVGEQGAGAQRFPDRSGADFGLVGCCAAACCWLVAGDSWV